jgi:hypothetical protein
LIRLVELGLGDDDVVVYTIKLLLLLVVLMILMVTVYAALSVVFIFRDRVGVGDEIARLLLIVHLCTRIVVFRR